MHSNNIYKIMKYYISLIVIVCFGIFSSIAQTNMTKIKDGTISGSSAVPNLGVILELESVNKGFLAPRLTTQQRDAISSGNRTDGMFIYNTSTGCFNYWSEVQDTWLSLCGTPPPAVFTISSIQCGAIKSNGDYTQGTFLNSSNFLTVPVSVTQAGTYEVSATTDNGYYFSTSGTFPSAGNYTLILEGIGTPNIGYNSGDKGDRLTVLLNKKASDCEPYVFVKKAAVDFGLDCSSVDIKGKFYLGKELTQENKITLQVNVSSTGYWNVQTNTVNGYSFRGSGTFDTTGVQTIELIGSGKPLASGTNLFSISSNSETTSSCSNVSITVAPIEYTVDCLSAIVQGVYKQDEAVTPGHTVTIKVDVKATGNTSIRTNTVAGIHFSSGPLSFDQLGVRDVVLTAVGTPNLPGKSTFTLDKASSVGMVAECSFDIDIVRQPVAYSMICSTITVNGKYAPNITMNQENTMVLKVNVQYIGDYKIETNNVNGVTFKATGTFVTTGEQEVILKAEGTPLAGGIHRFTLTTDSTLGGNTCNKNIEFVYRKMNVLGLGGGTYQPATASNTQTSRAVLQANSNFSPNGIVKVDGITIFNGATNQGTQLASSINNNKIDIIVIGYNYTPNAASISILADFVKNKKGVLIHSQENDANGTRDMINAIANSASTVVSGTGTTYTNPVVNIDDSVLNGPFGDLRSKATGSDVNNSYYVTGYSNEFTSLSHQDGNTSRSWFLKHQSLGYVYIGDSGWTSGDATNTSTTIWPAIITSGGTPIPKAYNAGVTVYNSILYANTITWAIKYAQEHIDINYQVK